MNEADAIFYMIKENRRRYELEAGAFNDITITELRRDIEQLKSREKVPEKILQAKETALLQAVDFFNVVIQVLSDYEKSMQLLKINTLVLNGLNDRLSAMVEDKIKGKY